MKCRWLEWSVVGVGIVLVALGLYGIVFGAPSLDKDKLLELADENLDAVRTFDSYDMHMEGRNRLRMTSNALIVLIEELKGTEQRLERCNSQLYVNQRKW